MLEGEKRRDVAGALGIAASLVLHLALATLLIALPPSELRGPVSIEVLDAPADPSVPVDSAQLGATRSNVNAPEVTPGGAELVQNVDAFDRGRGGDEGGRRAVVVLVTETHPVTLQDSPPNAYGASQTQRIDTSIDRATNETRRATPNPGDVPFLASGPGAWPERRPVAAVDPRSGARFAPNAQALGGAPGQRAGAPVDAPGQAAGGDAVARDPQRAGATETSPGRGLTQAEGARESEAARVAHGRPPVDRGPAATPTDWRDERVRDNRDAELLAAQLVQSWVESSERGGAARTPGVGGAGGGGTPGTGGDDVAGGRAQPLGPGDGAFASLDTRDARYLRWFLALRTRIERAVVFPRERRVALDQGTSVWRLVVRRDGSLHRRALVRSSGFADLDDAVRIAIERSVPFDALPSEVAPGAPEITVTFSQVFENPMVQ